VDFTSVWSLSCLIMKTYDYESLHCTYILINTVDNLKVHYIMVISTTVTVDFFGINTVAQRVPHSIRWATYYPPLMINYPTNTVFSSYLYSPAQSYSKRPPKMFRWLITKLVTTTSNCNATEIGHPNFFLWFKVVIWS